MVVMNKRVSAFLGVLIIFSLALIMVWPANAKATRIDVNSFEYDCGNGWEKDWMDGQVWHIRNYIHTNRHVSDFPELNGVATTTADAEFNLATGAAVLHGKISWKPNTIDGTWEGSWTFIGNAGISRGYAVAQGTGELFGKTLIVNLYNPPNPYTPELGTIMCDGLGSYESNTYVEGYILEDSIP
jgi:hypothetical protein